MYESYFGFREKPFTILPDPDFLFLSFKHTMALDLLEYGLTNQAGFNVITGEVGTGKTTLIRYLLRRVSDDVTIGLISNTHSNFGELMQWILHAFKLDFRGQNKVEMFHMFLEFLRAQQIQGKRVVLIVDEAQNMNAETLEELRMLSNVNTDKEQILQLILVGQPLLRETLRRPDLLQLAQRVAVDYHLEPLDLDETAQYIQHRVVSAGRRDPGLFENDACAAVYQHTLGTPRLINLLCDAALVYGFAEGRLKIDAQLVQDAAWDKKKGGIFPTLDGKDCE